MKKRILIILTVLCLAVVAVACGSDNQSSEQTTTTQKQEEGVTKAKILELYSAHTGADVPDGQAFIDMNYDQIVQLFGSEPTKNTGENDGEHSYSYTASDDASAKITFGFKDKNGVLECSSASKNFS